MQEYAEAALAHSEITQTYHEAHREPRFDAVLRKGELAKMVTEAVWLPLEIHVSEHQC
jgi:hypothetical protein